VAIPIGLTACQTRTSLMLMQRTSVYSSAANRAVFAEHGPKGAKVVWLALYEEKKIVDKLPRARRCIPDLA